MRQHASAFTAKFLKIENARLGSADKEHDSLLIRILFRPGFSEKTPPPRNRSIKAHHIPSQGFLVNSPDVERGCASSSFRTVVVVDEDMKFKSFRLILGESSQGVQKLRRR
jgi:hypothetical protein